MSRVCYQDTGNTTIMCLLEYPLVLADEPKSHTIFRVASFNISAPKENRSSRQKKQGRLSKIGWVYSEEDSLQKKPMEEEMQLQIAGGTGRRICDDRRELPSVQIGCMPLELLAKPVEIYDRSEHFESVERGEGRDLHDDL
ncbi:hypothetical protein ALC57_14097 [Trachymyrmex cornetzi]|uniref:Uncharacterized protein n=1 Tax=Trachymyrmex cornetzi TaxID=471704 RepID=A0A151IYS9_9HYME|nr:hypothetical protein ALC57_14097 [Trachymyrmex cornetzi]